MNRKFTIFVPHCSDLLTDHRPHGDGLVAHGFISRLAKRGHILHVAAQSVDLKEPLGDNVIIHRIPANRSGNIAWRISYMLKVRRLFWRLKANVKFDLIHQFNPVFTGLSLALAGSGLPVVLGTYVARWPDENSQVGGHHAMQQALSRSRRLISSLQQLQADTLVLTTPAAATRLANREWVRERICFLPHGIDTDMFSPQAPLDAQRIGEQDNSDLSILFLANVVRRKGIFTLLDAFAEVARQFPTAKLRIAGDGTELAAAKERAALMDCAARVEFVGRQDREQVPELYRNCSVYCLPSFGEPHAGTLVEAMSCGKPVVSTDSGGTPHLVTPQGGLLVPAGNASALSRALCEVLKDPVRRAEMGRHNRRLVEDTMSWQSVISQLENIYEASLSKRGDSFCEAAA